MKKITNKFVLALMFGSLVAFTSGCEKEDTADLSQITTYPDIKPTGGEFIRIELGSQTSYTDAGATAVDENGNPIEVRTLGSNVDVTQVGSYRVDYEATNKDGFTRTKQRIVNVIQSPTSKVDLEGIYERPANKRTSNVKKLAEGYYTMSDVWGSASSGGSPLPIQAFLLNFKGDSLLIVNDGDSPFGDGTVTGRGVIKPNGDISLNVNLGGASKRVNEWVRK